MIDQDHIRLREIKPVLAGYIREAQSLLNTFPVPDDKAVHDIRVLMKKSRALARLISTQADPETIKRDYDAYREVGRLLGSLRDTSVFRKTLKELKKNHNRLFSGLKENEHLVRLTKKPELTVDPLPAVRDNLQSAHELLSKAGYRLRFQNMSSFDPKLLLASLEDTYIIVAHRYMVARNKPRQENLHLFRKKAKDLLYQLWFFRPLNPAVIKSLEKRLDSMTQNLGKYNDLAQLLKILDYKYSEKAENHPMDQLLICIRDAQDSYLQKVWPSAYKIFCPGRTLVNVLGYKILTI